MMPKWMQTFSGRRFYPLDPQPEDIHIVDIAEALAKTCRYGGHCLYFYSVAEHSVLAAEHASEKNKMAALMHDASEAYIMDIPRPIKPMLGNYYDIEDKVMRAIASKYKFEWPLPQEVIDIDCAMLSDERDQIMNPMDVSPEEWGNTTPGLKTRLPLWGPNRASAEFIAAFNRYGGNL